MKQLFVITGLAESFESNWSGFTDFSLEIQRQHWPVTIARYNEKDFASAVIDPNIGPIYMIGNSFGGAAIYRWADLHPEVKIRRAITLDAVPDPTKKPRQWSCLEWARRPNIEFVLAFCEISSFLKGTHIKGGQRTTAPQAHESVKGALIHGDDGKTWAEEWVFDFDPRLGNFFDHFSIGTQAGHEWVWPRILEELA